MIVSGMVGPPAGPPPTVRGDRPHLRGRVGLGDDPLEYRSTSSSAWFQPFTW